ncbi:PEP/pyruvate-binding domain-containing protein [Stackebrandtia soli]|uniref:PEP/pyruvate-binding domain-containing protein n=1 Tax=Stackebrandtia soli TaxID=1892856 RepID=UPI0039EAFC32
MNATSPLCVPLGDARPSADLGGKAMSLSRLTQAGLPVPPGFCVVADAYRDHVRDSPVAARIEESLAGADLSDPAVASRVAAEIRDAFAESALSESLVSAVAEAYDSLGRPVVAVRSSATAEDLDDASFAGQMDTVLGVSDVDGVIAAVLRCWASLWTDRALVYRQRAGIEHGDVAMAVVVQELVDAEVSGVAFTADPITGATDSIVINATWGLGETLVGGEVTPDTFVVDRDSETVTTTIGSKSVETVRDGTGTRTANVDDERRAMATLTDDQAAELAQMASDVEKLYERHMDIEWTWRDGFALVQARPITVRGTEREVWNDSLTGDFLWTAGNLGEAVPTVMTPLTWSSVKETVEIAMGIPEVGDFKLTGNIGGRLYLNYTLLLDTTAAIGLGRLMRTMSALIFGSIPEDVVVPRIPLSRLRIAREAVPAGIAFQRAILRYHRRLPKYLEEFPERCEKAHRAIAAASNMDDLDRVWREVCTPLLIDAPHILAAGARGNGLTLAKFEPWLREHAEPADVGILASGAAEDSDGLDSLGPLLGLALVARGDLDRETFAQQWGHRSPTEMELSTPRPAEDPDWIDARLAGLEGGIDPVELLRRQRERRIEARERFARKGSRKLRRLDRIMRKATKSLRSRERSRSESVRALWVLRAFALRVGEITGIGDDVFFLSREEMERLFEGDHASLDRVGTRRATYRHYCGLPPYPALINGEFSPERWAADPLRRSDLYDAHAVDPRPEADTVTGTAGAAGVVEGVARVIMDVDDADTLQPGEILVTKATNVGWTPVFPRAAAVVTDVGAILSHAAIVARELGIPAVVGCGSATDRIATGDRVRVDGDTGTVDILTD